MEVSKGLRIYVKLSSLAFQGPSLKPYRHFANVKNVSGDQEKSTETFIQECFRMNLKINKQSSRAKRYKRLTYKRLSSYM